MGSLRIAYLASLAHSHVRQGKLLTKRDIYYMCRLLFSSPASVDRALDALSEGLQVPRNDLNIVAAPKGIVAGNIAFVDEDGHYLNVAMFGPDGCLIPPRPERMRDVVTDACAVVVYVSQKASVVYCDHGFGVISLVLTSYVYRLQCICHQNRKGSCFSLLAQRAQCPAIASNVHLRHRERLVPPLLRPIYIALANR